MPDLRYDTDTMREVASTYVETADTLIRLGQELERQIDDLKNVYWKSDAGDAFQKRYEEGWMNNVKKYVAVLQEMSKELRTAAGDYDTVTAKLREINGIAF